MTRARPFLFAAALFSSLLFAFVLRDELHDVVVIPLSYVGWQLWLSYKAVPELLIWIVLVILLGLVMVWQLIPEIRPVRQHDRSSLRKFGQVESLAIWILRARRSTYFKWQVANRLARVSKRLEQLVGLRSDSNTACQPVATYLAAGGEHSFVEFPPLRHSLTRRYRTPLDADPAEVVEYLESQVTIYRGSDAESL